jgi:hypothetical protein
MVRGNAMTCLTTDNLEIQPSVTPRNRHASWNKHWLRALSSRFTAGVAWAGIGLRHLVLAFRKEKDAPARAAQRALTPLIEKLLTDYCRDGGFLSADGARARRR